MGLPYEFRGKRTKDYHFELKLGDFSDDTILTIAIARWPVVSPFFAARTHFFLRFLLVLGKIS